MIRVAVARPTPVTDYALRETRRILAALEISQAGRDIELAVDPSQSTAVRVCVEGAAARLSGRGDASLLHAVYCFFEKLGCCFDFSGETLKLEALPESGWPEMSVSVEPSMPWRGIRMHLNFAQDQSCFTENAFAGFIDDIARMKMNYLLFHMYNGQEWYPFSYRGVEHLDLGIANLGRRPLPPGMIGRDKVRVRDHWFPADLEHIDDPRELRDAMRARYRRMMRRCRERGIRTAASIEPEALSDAFERELDAWQSASLADDWQQGWSGRRLAAADTRSPVMLDIAVERCLALIDAFPDLDELHLISREGTAWKRDDDAEYGLEARRIAERFGFPVELVDLEACAKTAAEPPEDIPVSPRANPYWTVLPGDSYCATVFGALRFVEFAVEILADPRLAAKSAEHGVSMSVAIYSPNPETVRLMSPAVAEMLPPGTPVSYLADYGARDICDGMDNWRPLFDKGLPVGLISWLEFDGCMMLAQGWARSVYDNVQKALAMGVRTACFNHWRVRSLEFSAKVAAEACFDASRGADTLMAEIAAARHGAGAAGAAAAAEDALEAATLYAKAYNYNIGFTNDWVYEHSTGTPGYAWQRLVESRRRYRAARDAFGELAARGAQWGERQALYMADVCAISAMHVEAVYHLQNAKLPLMGFDAWPPENPGAVWCGAPLLRTLLDSARKALSLEESYMRVYGGHVSSCDEQGQLSMHHLGVIEPFARFVRMLEAQLERALAQPQMEE